MKFSAAELGRNRNFVYRNYFVYNTRDDMIEALQKAYGIEITTRTLRTYFRWAERKMTETGALKIDEKLLKDTLVRTLERLRRLGEQGARDEARARSMNVYKIRRDDEGNVETLTVEDPKTGQLKPVMDPDAIMRQDTLIKSATYRQLNIEKQILDIFGKIGVAVPREEIDVHVSQELAVLLVQANIAIAYDYVAPERRHEYIEAASVIEGARVEELEAIVQGKFSEIEGGK